MLWMGGRGQAFELLGEVGDPVDSVGSVLGHVDGVDDRLGIGVEPFEGVDHVGGLEHPAALFR